MGVKIYQLQEVSQQCLIGDRPNAFAEKNLTVVKTRLVFTAILEGGKYKVWCSKGLDFYRINKIKPPENIEQRRETELSGRVRVSCVSKIKKKNKGFYSIVI
jgi:hypothetical protein